MPIDYARTAGGMADLVQQPVNALYRAKYAAEENNRQNAVVAEGQQRTNLYGQNMLMQDRRLREQDQAQATEAQHQQQSAQILAAVRAGVPQAVDSGLSLILSAPGLPEDLKARLAQATPDEKRAFVEHAMAAAAGEKMPEPPAQPPQVQDLGGGVRAVVQGGEIVGSPQWPQRAPLDGGGGGYRQLSPDEVAAAGYPQGSIVEVGPKGQQSLKYKPSEAMTVETGPNGERIVTPGKTNDVMRTASGFVARMSASEKLLGDYSPSAKDYIAGQKVMSSGPIVASLANKALSPAGQKYYQAAADWVRAKLRKESGAVIGPEEMAQEIKTYFPLPGDGPAVVAQKAQARAQALEALKTQAGGAVTPSAAPQGGVGTVIRYDRNGKRIP